MDFFKVEVCYLDFYSRLFIKFMRSHNKIEIPKDFAQRILDNEIEFKLADKPSSEIICNLIELYSTGISYY